MHTSAVTGDQLIPVTIIEAIAPAAMIAAIVNAIQSVLFAADCGSEISAELGENYAVDNRNRFKCRRSRHVRINVRQPEN